MYKQKYCWKRLEKDITEKCLDQIKKYLYKLKSNKLGTNEDFCFMLHYKHSECLSNT